MVAAAFMFAMMFGKLLMIIGGDEDDTSDDNA